MMHAASTRPGRARILSVVVDASVFDSRIREGGVL